MPQVATVGEIGPSVNRAGDFQKGLRYHRSMRKLLLFVGIVAFAQGPWPPPGMQCPQRTLVLFEFGANAARSADFQSEHFAYVLGLLKSGKVISAGPMADGRSAAILFATKDWAEAEALIKREPFNREGVLKVTSHSVWNACEASR
jgi:uncharacterized protein YciI